MSQAATFVLRTERDRQMAMRFVQRAELGRQVKVSKPDRNLEQNKHYHALLGDIAKQLIWPQPPRNDGQLHEIEWWKRRTSLGWLIDKKKEFEVIESLEGAEVGILLPHTSDLSEPDMQELIEWTASFGAHNGVIFKEPAHRPEPPAEAYA